MKHNAVALPAALLAAVMILCPAVTDAASKTKKKKVKASSSESAPVQGFDVYTDAKSPGNHFLPSGWMGDTSDVSLSDSETLRPHSGRTCIKVTYRAQGGAGWAGVFWQNPANNWGTRPGAGYDLSQYKKISFWARGEKGGEVLTEVKVGGIKGQYPDTDEVSTKNLILSDQWTPYVIDLEGRNLSNIIGGFCLVFARDTNPSGATVYLDDIIYSKK